MSGFPGLSEAEGSRTTGGNNSVVECDLAKVEVAGSNPVSRSNITRGGPSPRSVRSAPWGPGAHSAPRAYDQRHVRRVRSTRRFVLSAVVAQVFRPAVLSGAVAKW